MRGLPKMKSTPFDRGAQWVFLTIAFGASSVPLLALASPPGTEVTAPQMIDAFEGTFGVHPGQRRNHIKGTCAAGEFVGTTDAAALSRSALFSGKTIPVVARFSLGGGSPEVPDAAPAPRGMALEFHLPGGALQHITMIDVPIFAATSPASFRDAIVAAKPDPKTGQPDPEKLKAYAATHPDSMALTEAVEPPHPDGELLSDHLLQHSHVQVHRCERHRAPGEVALRPPRWHEGDDCRGNEGGAA